MAIKVRGNTVIYDDEVLRVSANTEANRPGSPVIGMIRYNTTSNTFEGYSGTSWGAIGGSSQLRVVNSSANTGTLTPNGATTDVFNAFNLAGNVTIEAPSGTPTDGQRLIIRLEDNGSARALTWNVNSGGYRTIGVTLPTTTSIGKLIYVGTIYNSTDTFWDVVAVTIQT